MVIFNTKWQVIPGSNSMENWSHNIERSSYPENTIKRSLLCKIESKCHVCRPVIVNLLLLCRLDPAAGQRCLTFLPTGSGTGSGRGEERNRKAEDMTLRYELRTEERMKQIHVGHCCFKVGHQWTQSGLTAHGEARCCAHAMICFNRTP
jgi:hypothetical protein